MSRMANEFSDSYALKAICLIYENLIAVYKDGKNLLRREKLQIASSMAGIAFNNSTLGINHSLAHALGAKFHPPPGRANGILLPYVLEYNLKDEDTQKRYADIARHLGFAFEDDHIAAIALIESVKLLKKSLGIPASLLDAGVDRTAFIESLDEVTDAALKDLCTPGNPVLPTEQDLRGLLLKLV